MPIDKEAVRCGDCQHWKINEDNQPYCSKVWGLFEEMKPDNFCIYGTRKTE